MKIAHFISSIDISTGGPARSVTHLIKKILEKQNVNVTLYTSVSNNPIISSFKTNNGVIFFSKSIKNLKNNTNKNKLDGINLFHGHGLWQRYVHHMSKQAIIQNIPYIITPRGMLEPWSLTQGRLKKKLALKLFQYKDLKNAACIHATAPMEVESIRNLGFTNPIAMIPNGIQLNEFPASSPNKCTLPKKMLFLSRIHIKKGIENLIEAWALIPTEYRASWEIDIVGNGDEVYIKSLKDKIVKYKLAHQIRIKPPVFGEEKVELFRSASLFVLPTFSENFGIVIAEALASFTPVITTKGTPWGDLEKTNCGWWIDIGVAPLKKALEKAIQTNEQDLIKMGKNGRILVEEKYSMKSVANQMLALYKWILTKENKPDFINIL